MPPHIERLRFSWNQSILGDFENGFFTSELYAFFMKKNMY